MAIMVVVEDRIPKGDWENDGGEHEHGTMMNERRDVRRNSKNTDDEDDGLCTGEGEGNADEYLMVPL